LGGGITLNWSKKKLKKAPLPWILREQLRDPTHQKIMLVIKRAFERMFGDKFTLSCSEKKLWGEFLNERAIHWKIKLPRQPADCDSWNGWDFVMCPRDSVLLAQPKDLEGYLEVGKFFIPQDLADKMLVLGDIF
jgi:hypothetical protein